MVELVRTPQLLGCGEFFGALRHESGCETVSACELLALDARKLSTYGGSNEVQRNIVAQTVLGS